MLEFLTQPLSEDFFLRALVALTLGGAACACLGVYVVLRRMAFVSTALTHSILPGVTGAVLLGISPYLGALAAALLTAAGAAWLASRKEVSEDAAIGVMLSVMLAAGVALMQQAHAWRDYGGLLFGSVVSVGPEDLAAVGATCAELGIELVPNLNTFGHLERWLRHEPYRRLAECPEGWTHPLTGQFKPHPSTLCPDDASLAFVAGLLDGYLPRFASGQVNIGGDEPWELGQGRSREAVDARGKHRVYLDFLNRIHGLVRARGKRMQFWGDILLEDLALAGDAPAEALPVVWGYDPGHPFDAQCGRLAELGRDFLIAPGAGTWQSFTGRLADARTNVREATAAALRHGADGVLMTAWGDNGYHQPWPTFWIPLGEAAAMAWCGTANAEPDPVLAVLPFLEDGADAPEVAAALEALGELDGRIPVSIRNKSLAWELLCGDPAARAELGLRLAVPDVVKSLGWLGACADLVRRIGDARVREELLLGTMLAQAGLITAGQRPPSEDTRRELAERHRRAWLARARPGGLAESLALLGLG